jgi:hypothetical protein
MKKILLLSNILTAMICSQGLASWQSSRVCREAFSGDFEVRSTEGHQPFPEVRNSYLPAYLPRMTVRPLTRAIDSQGVERAQWPADARSYTSQLRIDPRTTVWFFQMLSNRFGFEDHTEYLVTPSAESFVKISDAIDVLRVAAKERNLYVEPLLGPFGFKFQVSREESISPISFLTALSRGVIPFGDSGQHYIDSLAVRSASFLVPKVMAIAVSGSARLSLRFAVFMQKKYPSDPAIYDLTQKYLTRVGLDFERSIEVFSESVSKLNPYDGVDALLGLVCRGDCNATEVMLRSVEKSTAGFTDIEKSILREAAKAYALEIEKNPPEFLQRMAIHDDIEYWSMKVTNNVQYIKMLWE